MSQHEMSGASAKRAWGSWSNKAGEGEGMRWLLAHVGHAGDECLEWPLSRSAKGYGVVGYLGKVSKAHRVMCELVHGPAPSPKHHACHSCGRGDLGCVNPRHLSWKTPSENMQDKKVHGTLPKRLRRYKLTPAQVNEIRAIEGVTVAAMAAQYGVSESCIGKVRSGETWRDDVRHKRLTPEEIQAIRDLRGLRSLAKVGAEFGISDTRVRRIQKGIGCYAVPLPRANAMKIYMESHSGWTVGDPPGFPCGEYHIKDANGWPLATLHYDYRYTCNATNISRANLLAAAPEILEALRPLARWYEDPTAKPTLEDCERASAALAKAEGKP